ncbi:MAG: adenylosuccinate synthase [Verrucomicrobia bacterium]|nr:adenylosuccinate synthase [Verrucomicrobiota bacterium]
MANTILVGGQWGDEGKGRIIDVLAEKSDYVVRYQGGNNAGHEVHIGDAVYVLHLIPSGILHPGKVCVIGNGVVVDPVALVDEIKNLRRQGIRITPQNLVISETAHLVLPYHKLLDAERESRKGAQKIGTTKRGIGPAYGDKAARIGIRVLDLLKTARFREKLRTRIEENNAILRAGGGKPLSFDAVCAECLRAGRFLRPFIRNGVTLLHDAMRQRKNILFEGAQGTLLDIDFGTYPYVTSSHPTAGGACVGSGIPPTCIDRVVGVVKAYTTRVGEGPFPTQYDDELGTEIQKIGDEFGRTTGRGRRCGWFDSVVVRYAQQINGINDLAVTKLDVLDHLSELKICVAYRNGRKAYRTIPMDLDDLRRCKPVYETYKGWQTSTKQVRRYRDLPLNARTYLAAISRHCGAPISIVSVGPRRHETVLVRNSS